MLYGRQDRQEKAEECFADARVAYAIIGDVKDEAKAFLDGLIEAYALQRKFVDARLPVWKFAKCTRKWAGR